MSNRLYLLFEEEVSDREKIRRSNIAAFRQLENDGTLASFSLLRAYIQHEDTLVSQRTGWFLTLNSFLFASAALVFGGDIRSGAFTELQVTGFVVVIGFVGLVSSLMAFLAIGAAYSANKALKDLWVDKYEPMAVDFGCVTEVRPVPEDDPQANKEFLFRNDSTRLLPYIKGGGHRRRIAKKGRYIAHSLPILIGLAWFVILLISGWSYLLGVWDFV